MEMQQMIEHLLAGHEEGLLAIMEAFLEKMDAEKEAPSRNKSHVRQEDGNQYE
jgi:hypothetical protein